MLRGLYLLSQEGQCPGHPAFRENPLAHTGESSRCCVCLLWDCYKLLQSSQWMAFLCIAVDTSISSDIRPWQWITVLTDCCLNRSYFSFSKTVWRWLLVYRWVLWIFTLNLWPQKNGSESDRLSSSLWMLNPGNARQLDGLRDQWKDTVSLEMQ